MKADPRDPRYGPYLRYVFAEDDKPTAKSKDVLAVAARLLHVLADPKHPRRDAAEMTQLAREVSYRMALLADLWHRGRIAHVEDALGWRRPRNWKQMAKTEPYRLRAWYEVSHRIVGGETIPGVFWNVAGDLGRSESFVRDAYYEIQRRTEPSAARATSGRRKAGPAISGTRPRNQGKTKRT